MHEHIEYGYDEIEPSKTKRGNKVIYGIVDKQSGNINQDIIYSLGCEFISG